MFLKIKDIIMTEDSRESNLIKDDEDEIIGHKQSKCTCKFVLENDQGEKYIWVADNKSLARALELIAENEDKKYDIENKPWLLGRNMFFLSWLYDIWEKYLSKYGFKPPQKDIDKAQKFKGGKN